MGTFGSQISVAVSGGTVDGGSVNERESNLFGESRPLRHIEQRVQSAAKVFTQAERIKKFSLRSVSRIKLKRLGVCRSLTHKYG